MISENEAAWEDLSRGIRILCRTVRELIEGQEENTLKEPKELTALAKDAAAVLKAVEERGTPTAETGGVIEIGKARRARKRKEEEA